VKQGYGVPGADRVCATHRRAEALVRPKAPQHAQALQFHDVLGRASRCFSPRHQDSGLDGAPDRGLGQVGTAEKEGATVGDRQLGVLA